MLGNQSTRVVFHVSDTSSAYLLFQLAVTALQSCKLLIQFVQQQLQNTVNDSLYSATSQPVLWLAHMLEAVKAGEWWSLLVTPDPLSTVPGVWPNQSSPLDFIHLLFFFPWGTWLGNGDGGFLALVMYPLEFLRWAALVFLQVSLWVWDGPGGGEHPQHSQQPGLLLGVHSGL